MQIFLDKIKKPRNRKPQMENRVKRGITVGSYFSATRRLVENFYQTSSTKSSARRLVEQKIWANMYPIQIFPSKYNLKDSRK